MSNFAARIGIDYRSGTVYAARVEFDQHQPQIKGMVRVNPESGAGHRLLENGEIVLAVPDRKVMVKRIHLEKDERNESGLRSRFELAQMLLEDEQQFNFDLVETSLPETTLGLIMRKENLANLAGAQWLAPIVSGRTPDYRMRAVALGKAYLNFCHRQESVLVCLTDFNGPELSVSLLVDNQIAAVTSVDMPEPIDNTAESWGLVASELRTAVNFQLSSIASLGVTNELEGILITGIDIDGTAGDCLKKHFPEGVSAPQLDETLPDDIARQSKIPLGNYLVALGLTVDWTCPGQD